jgi:hypothetical protein
MTSKQLSNNSEKYFIAKFTKEIIKIWSSLTLDDKSQTNETLNYVILKEFLLRLGFINETQFSNDTMMGDKNLIFEIWRVLGG